MHFVSPKKLSLNDIKSLILENSHLELSEESVNAIDKCRDFLRNKLENSSDIIYGINTGFGSLCDIVIQPDELRNLQTNLVRSHACGAGNPVPESIVRIMLLLKIQSLSYGYSGVKKETVERLIYFYNHGLTPLVFEKGSLGASGDLAPLAHLSLPLIGEGEFLIN